MAYFPIRDCPLCSRTFKRTTKLEDHITSDHGITPESAYVAAYHADQHPVCKCGCGSKLQFNGWKRGFSTYVKGHGASFGGLSDDQKREIRNKKRMTLTENIRTGRVVGWSKGLTKETDVRLAVAAERRSATMKSRFETGEIVPWSKGLSKNNSDAVKRAAEGLATAYAEGRLTPWSKGLTKATDPRLFALGRNVSKTLRENIELSMKLSNEKRLTDDEIMSRIASIAPNFTLLTPLSEYTTSQQRNLTLVCNRCGTQKIRSLNSISDSCNVCNVPSLQQREIGAFVTGLGFQHETTRDVIKPYELDVYIPSRAFAIEFNGLWWHRDRDGERDPNRHSRKTFLCAARGIRLFHVFSDEWKNKREIVESMIRCRLYANSIRLNARDCKIVQLEHDDRVAFFDQNHIDGDVAARQAWGLLTPEGCLVSAISIRKSIHSKWAGYIEIARFATVLNTTVRGALGKLLTHVQSMHSMPIVSFVDTRHGDGHSYETIGMELVHTTANRFWWSNGTVRYDRFKYRADQARSLTEKQVAEEAGVYRVWGCPNRVYIKRLNQSSSPAVETPAPPSRP